MLDICLVFIDFEVLVWNVHLHAFLAHFCYMFLRKLSSLPVSVWDSNFSLTRACHHHCILFLCVQSNCFFFFFFCCTHLVNTSHLTVPHSAHLLETMSEAKRRNTPERVEFEISFDGEEESEEEQFEHNLRASLSSTTLLDDDSDSDLSDSDVE